MLEALIDLGFHADGQDLPDRRGDIVQMTLAGAPWGRLERRRHYRVIQFNAPVLEAKLRERITPTNPFPRWILPFADDARGLRSTKRINFEKLAAAAKAALLDREKDAAIVPAATIAAAVEDI
jgi:hypothetical protein